MTLKISLVAVCCSKDSLKLLGEPHVLDGDHCLASESSEQFKRVFSEKGRTSMRLMSITPIGVSFSDHRRAEKCPEPPA